MSSDTGTGPGQSTVQTTTVGGCLVQLFAEIAGVMLLAVLSLFILLRPAWQLSWIDIAFAGVAIAIPITRARLAKKAGVILPPSMYAKWYAIAVIAWLIVNAFHLR